MLKAELALTDEHYLEGLPKMNGNGDKVNLKGAQLEIMSLFFCFVFFFDNFAIIFRLGNHPAIHLKKKIR